jgi:HSP20 family molecular chaperone IbpA
MEAKRNQMGNPNQKGRVSIPGRVINMLYGDDEFYREVSSLKKVSIQNFPKYDQWVDEDTFHMEFALAGYAPDDISVNVTGNVLTLIGSKEASDGNDFAGRTGGEDGDLSPKLKVMRGMIVRGIARRSFTVDFFISNEYDLSDVYARMKDGLLKVSVPRIKNFGPTRVIVEQG